MHLKTKCDAFNVLKNNLTIFQYVLNEFILVIELISLIKHNYYHASNSRHKIFLLKNLIK